MKKLLLCLTMLILLISCDFSLIRQSGEPFKETVLSDKESDTIKFLILSDTHLGRGTEDDNVTDYSNAILSYINEEDGYAFALIGGDLVDTAYHYEKAKSFIAELKVKMGNDNVIYALGNHDTHCSTKKHWLEYDFGDKEHDAYHKYSYDGLSIYKLDSADRSLGYGQISALETALKKDTNEFKLMLSHVPISGRFTEATAAQFTIATAEERYKIVSLMKQYKVGTYLSGHHHKGNYEAHYDDTTGGFIIAAAHARDHFGLESTGFYYEGILDKSNKVLTIKAKHAKDNTLAYTYTFKQP